MTKRPADERLAWSEEGARDERDGSPSFSATVGVPGIALRRIETHPEHIRAVARSARWTRDDPLLFQNACPKSDDGEPGWALADSNRRPPACKYDADGSQRTRRTATADQTQRANVNEPRRTAATAKPRERLAPGGCALQRRRGTRDGQARERIGCDRPGLMGGMSAPERSHLCGCDRRFVTARWAVRPRMSLDRASTVVRDRSGVCTVRDVPRWV